MASPSPSRPGFVPPDRLTGPAEPAGGGTAPTGAVTLADLIADSGPLPPDAALECVQRLAERLTRTPEFSCRSLTPADVLLDDDGGVWLREEPAPSLAALPSTAAPEGLDRLGRLLAFLATGNGSHLDEQTSLDAAALPLPVSTVAGRLLSRNGLCYRSYADLARSAALLRGAAPALEIEKTLNEDSQAAMAAGTASEPIGEKPASSTMTFAAAVAAAALLGAAAAYAIWHWL